MSKTERLDELPKLTKENLELDGDDWLDDDALSDEQKALLEARLTDMELHPETSIPWAEAKRRLQERFLK